MMEKVNAGYLPSDGENLVGYTERLRHILAEEWGYLESHVKWYVHRGTGPCPICNIYNISSLITDMMVDAAVTLKSKKMKMVCVMDPNNPDPLLFRFKIQST